jgi:hypothetical protein
VSLWEANGKLLVRNSAGTVDRADSGACSVKVKVKVTLRLAVYRQSIHLGARPLETHDQRFLFQLNSCGNSPYVTSSDEKMSLSVMNMLGLSSSVHSAHIACY